MERKIVWSNLPATGLEQLRLVWRDDGIFADGIVLGVEQDVAFRIRYEISCDVRWRVRKVVVRSLDEIERTISLTSDGVGHWTNESGEAISELEGCRDVDISATPFTNTLPIRCLALRSGESSELRVAYVAVPEMRTSVERQRYTCLELSDAGSKYRFESLDGNFTAILTVDADGLVKDYPDLFKRVWAT